MFPGRAALARSTALPGHSEICAGDGSDMRGGQQPRGEMILLKQTTQILPLRERAGSFSINPKPWLMMFTSRRTTSCLRPCNDTHWGPPRDQRRHIRKLAVEADDLRGFTAIPPHQDSGGPWVSRTMNSLDPMSGAPNLRLSSETADLLCLKKRTTTETELGRPHAEGRSQEPRGGPDHNVKTQDICFLGGHPGHRFQDCSLMKHSFGQIRMAVA